MWSSWLQICLMCSLMIFGFKRFICAFMLWPAIDRLLLARNGSWWTKWSPHPYPSLLLTKYLHPFCWDLWVTVASQHLELLFWDRPPDYRGWMKFESFHWRKNVTISINLVQSAEGLVPLCRTSTFGGSLTDWSPTIKFGIVPWHGSLFANMLWVQLMSKKSQTADKSVHETKWFFFNFWPTLTCR